MRHQRIELLLVIFVLGISGNAMAQSAPVTNGIESINTLLNHKEVFLQEEMQLSDLENEVFSSMYLNYMEELLLLDDSQAQYQKSLVRSAEFATDPELAVLSLGMLEIEQSKVNDKLEFFNSLVKEFGLQKASLWLRAEIEFQEKLIKLYGQSGNIK